MLFVSRLMCLLAMLASLSLDAWTDTGHMIVAEIASRQLSPQAKKQIDELINLFKPYFPESDSIITASCWADDLTEYSLYALDEWHFIRLPYDPEHILNETERSIIAAGQKNKNLEWAINQCIETVTSPKAGPFEKAFMLRLLLHFVGDAHQPLYCIALYNKDFPQGDRGGLLFHIVGVPGTNLNKYWNSGLGLFKDVNRPLNLQGKQYVEKLAKEIAEEFPLDKTGLPINDDVHEWIQESHEVAIHVAYEGVKQGDRLSEEYISKGQKAVRKRVAIAGYRLGHLLNLIFEKQHRPIPKVID